MNINEYEKRIKIDSDWCISIVDCLGFSGVAVCCDEPITTTAEPLKLELKCFIKSIRKGVVLDPLCSGQEAFEVLKIVEKSFNKLGVSK